MKLLGVTCNKFILVLVRIGQAFEVIAKCIFEELNCVVIVRFEPMIVR